MGTIGIIQNAIDKGMLNGHLDQASLVGLANNLLYGKKIEKYQVENGKGTYVEDLELTRIAQKLWREYVKPINEQRQKEDLKQAGKQKVHNTGQGNRAGF